MKQILFAIAFTALAAMPAKADTAFWFTCDFDGGAGLQSTSFGLFAEGGNGSIAFGQDADLRPIIWYDVGETTHLFSNDLSPPRWVLSFDAETQTALGYADAHLVHSTSCRGGTE